MIPMRACDVLCNLKNWTSWDYKAYKLQENEAAPVIKALNNYIWHDIATSGWPKEECFITIKCLDEKDGIYYMSTYYYSGIENDFSDGIAWRYIIEEE